MTLNKRNLWIFLIAFALFILGLVSYRLLMHDKVIEKIGQKEPSVQQNSSVTKYEDAAHNPAGKNTPPAAWAKQPDNLSDEISSKNSFLMEKDSVALGKLQSLEKMQKKMMEAVNSKSPNIKDAIAAIDEYQKTTGDTDIGGIKIETMKKQFVYLEEMQKLSESLQALQEKEGVGKPLPDTEGVRKKMNRLSELANLMQQNSQQMQSTLKEGVEKSLQ